MIGLEMLKAPPFASVIEPPAVVVTELLKVKAPVVVSAIGPAIVRLEFAKILAALLTVKDVKEAPDPIDPCKLTFPVPAAKVSGKAPLIVDEKVMSPAPEFVFNELIPVRFTDEAKLILSFVVVIVSPSSTLPEPLCAKGPSSERVKPSPKVS